jgi:hypothetical protein
MGILGTTPMKSIFCALPTHSRDFTGQGWAALKSASAPPTVSTTQQQPAANRRSSTPFGEILDAAQNI